MALMVYNTLSGEKEEFKPMVGNRVFMFVCGPTVYDESHLGHARTYISFDMIARYLRFKGYDLFYLMNITDIDDNIIRRANQLERPSWEIAEEYFEHFVRDMKALNMDQVNLYAKATAHVPEIINQAQTLIDKDYAYESDGYVYFEVHKFEDFGKLSHQKLDHLQAGARVEVDDNKRNPQDFVLWKSRKPGEPTWDSPWGPGRPGWHIEDTAITTKYFGDQYDIHGGARDLIFPHHESEITIAESATGKKPFVKYWFHTGFLNVEGEKMSKSLGNFFTIQEVLEKYGADVVRFFLLYTHYRSPIDFAEAQLGEAQQGYERIYNTILNVRSLIDQAEEKGAGSDQDQELVDAVKTFRKRFIEVMDDDFNTREAIAAMFDFSRAVNKLSNKECTKKVLTDIVNAYNTAGEILGLFLTEARSHETGVEAELTKDLMDLILDVREQLRNKKEFELSDQLRDKLTELGVVLEDTADGVKWRIGKKN
jgi:cysteinyl-tRNA synthetase